MQQDRLVGETSCVTCAIEQPSVLSVVLQGNLVVQAKYWLPLQLAAYASIIYWAIPFHVSATTATTALCVWQTSGSASSHASSSHAFAAC
jgi:hypothetical protein